MLFHCIVYSVVLDDTRNQCYSGSMDGTVRIWSLKTGQLLHTLTGHTSLVGLLCLSPTTLVSAAADSTLRIWDPNTGQLLRTLAEHAGAITCFQHDEYKVLSGSDGTLKMWDTRDGTVIKDLLTGITGVWQVVFDERFCVAASNRQDHTYLDVWDFAGDDDDDADVEAAKIGEENEETDEEDDGGTGYTGTNHGGAMDEWSRGAPAGSGSGGGGLDQDDAEITPGDWRDRDGSPMGAGRSSCKVAPMDLGQQSPVGGRRAAAGLGLGFSEGMRLGSLPLPPTTSETPTRPRMRNARAGGPR